MFLARDRVGHLPAVLDRGRATGFSSAPRSRRCSPPARVPATADPRGLDHLFTFFAMGTRRTMFRGRAVGAAGPLPQDCVPPRRQAHRGRASTAIGTSTSPTPATRTIPPTRSALIDEFEATFQRAVEVRLRADVPVGRLPLRRRRFRLRGCNRLAGCAARRFRASPSRCPARASTRPNEASLIARARWQPPDRSCASDAKVIADTYAQSHRRGRLPGAGHFLRRAAGACRERCTTRATRWR